MSSKRLTISATPPAANHNCSWFQYHQKKHLLRVLLDIIAICRASEEARRQGYVSLTTSELIQLRVLLQFVPLDDLRHTVTDSVVACRKLILQITDLRQ